MPLQLKRHRNISQPRMPRLFLAGNAPTSAKTPELVSPHSERGASQDSCCGRTWVRTGVQ